MRRRLWELSRSAEEASRVSRWVIPPEILQRMAHAGGTSFISEGLAKVLARALEVPENQVRKAAGLPEVDDPRADITTGPHLRVIRGGER